ncbi:protein PHYTOCHROME-DEPENDENT LATE-FLOWERING-like isoform X2 [Rhododendron vialii]|uniref:protein PHYTOCHROME-DEPENDENT LATE-FLOWERING-like isoform X2 n=1 Tax=Rhododendron vialii TaxID=182163 RepID=UPI00265E8F04|nr:protein PHYTOCHROME-DEPENDENT LATE-FLOWERING-like isoform X2 [Rhododendron vialii]
MGVSFKVAKAGTRYRPKPVQVEAKEIDSEPTFDCQRRGNEVDVIGLGDEVTDYSIAMAKPGLHLVSKDPDVSFSLSLFPGGFTIGKPNELFSGVPKQLHPYDRASETLFCAIESGCLPGDILDDLPCKYVNGALLCEIRDYRNSMPRNGDTGSSVENSPVRSKVFLQMCTESVVKDISLISDDSWTYNDLLEFESRILKALRPDLQLDPTPMLNRLCEESQSEKLNLGISWCRKRRKLNDAFTVDHISSNTSLRIEALELCARNSNSQSGGEFQDGVSCIEQLTPNYISTSQRNNTHQENMPHCSLLTYQSDFQSAVDQSLHGALTSHALPAPEPNYGYVDPTPYGGPISKIPMKEPLDISQEQLPEKQAQTKLPTKSKLKNKLPNQKTKAEKSLCKRSLYERTRKKMHPSACRINNGQQAICEGIPRLQQVPTFRVTQEQIETSSCQSLNVGARDNRPTDLRCGPNLLQAQPSQSLGFVKSNFLDNATPCSLVCQSSVKNITQEVVTVGQRGEALQHSRVSCGANSSLPSRLSNSLPRQASFPTKGQNYHLKGLSENSVESLAGINSTNTASAQCGSETPFPRPSVIEDPVPIDPVLDRFFKAEWVSQKYALNKKKRKVDQFFERKPFSGTAELLSSHLLDLEDKNLKDGKTDATSHSECSRDNNRIKTRKFTFQRSGAACIKAWDEVTIFEKLDEGLVEATLTSGREESDPIDSCRLQAFANTHHADLFAAQFSSLMIREGYRQGGDQMEIALHDIAGSSSSRPQILYCTTTPAAETFEPVPSTPITGQSPCTLNPTNSSLSVSTLIPRHASSQNNFPGGHLLPSANIQSALPLPAGYFSTSPLEIASQFSPMHPQWQHIMNRRAFLEFQMLQRDWLQQQLLRRRMMMMGGFLPAPGTMQISSGVHGTRNVGLNSTFGDPVGYISLLGGGNIQDTGSSCGKNTPTAVMARRIRMAENGGGALMSGFSVDEKAGVGPPNLPMSAYQTTNRLPLSMQMQQLCTQESEEMRKLIQPQGVTCLTEHVGSPLSSSSLIQNRATVSNELTGIGASSVGFWEYNGGP